MFLILAITAATFDGAIDDDFIMYSSLPSLNKFMICFVISFNLTPSSSNTYPRYSGNKIYTFKWTISWIAKQTYYKY